MKTNNIIYVSFTLLIILCVGFNIYFIREQNNNINELTLLNAQTKTKYYDAAQKLNILIRNDSLQRLQAYKLRLNSGKLPYVFKAKSDSSILVLRISPGGCNQCVNSVIKLFEKYRHEKKIRLLIIAKYTSAEAFQADFSFIPKQYDRIIDMDNTLVTDLPGTNLPYLFLYKDERIFNVFYPDYTLFQSIENYFRFL